MHLTFTITLAWVPLSSALKPGKVNGPTQAHRAGQLPEEPLPASGWGLSQGRGLAGERSAWPLCGWGTCSPNSVWGGGALQAWACPSHTAGLSGSLAPRLVLLTCPAGCCQRSALDTFSEKEKGFLGQGPGSPWPSTPSPHRRLRSQPRAGRSERRSAGPWDSPAVDSRTGESVVLFRAAYQWDGRCRVLPSAPPGWEQWTAWTSATPHSPSVQAVYWGEVGGGLLGRGPAASCGRGELGAEPDGGGGGGDAREPPGALLA